MSHRERAMALLHYEPYDHLPVVHFGFWSGHTPQKWAAEGHISEALAKDWTDGNEADFDLGAKLGFDFNWQCMFGGNGGRPEGTRQRFRMVDRRQRVIRGKIRRR